jgi:hypothetical protein
MTRETYVIRDGKLVPKRKARPLNAGPSFVPDIQPFTTTDGVEITSRSQLRAYEIANGVRQVGNDWSGSEKPRWWDERMSRK